MVSQKRVLAALFYFSTLVFVSIWLMTRHFPEKKCDCSSCPNANVFKRNLKQRRNTPEEKTETIQGVELWFSATWLHFDDGEPLDHHVQSLTLTTKVTIKGSDPKTSQHKLGVIVPFRNRFEELLEFVPHMSKYLREKDIQFHIYVINQVDLYRFNRASLINIGYLTAINDSCDYIAMHDVDLLPLNKDLNYGYPESGPFHVSAPSLHPKYHYAKFIGGILLMTDKQFKKVNGLSTRFWGWGREDDELYMRISDADMTIFRPVGIETGYDTFTHNHNKNRKRDYPRDRTQFKESFKRDYESGVNTMNHKISNRYEMTIKNEGLSMLAIELQCDHELTPWCDS